VDPKEELLMICRDRVNEIIKLAEKELENYHHAASEDKSP